MNVCPPRRQAAFLGALVAALCIFIPTTCAQTYIYDSAFFATGRGPSAVVVADFNGDGVLDLAVANEQDNTVSILLGVPGGTFEPEKSYASGSSPLGLVAADFNGDGKLDLAVMNSCGDCTVSPNTITILLGNGDGTFQTSGDYATGGGPIGIVQTSTATGKSISRSRTRMTTRHRTAGCRAT